MGAGKAAPPGAARIFEGGYRRYDGQRLGAGHAFNSLRRHTLQRVLGLRRRATAKILPILTIVLAYLPAAVFVGVIALIPERRLTDFIIPPYGDYYGYVTLAIFLFVSFVAPEALCPDRRFRVLSLYLASPLTRTTYLLAKAAAIASVLCVVTVGPTLLLLIGRVFQGAGPDGPGGVALVLVRILAAGVAVSAIYTAVSMAIASVTDRRAFASAGTVLLIIGSNIVVSVLHFVLDLPAAVRLGGLTLAPVELASRIFGEPGSVPSVPTVTVAAAGAAWVAVAAAFTWWRYRTLQVTR